MFTSGYTAAMLSLIATPLIILFYLGDYSNDIVGQGLLVFSVLISINCIAGLISVFIQHKIYGSQIEKTAYFLIFLSLGLIGSLLGLTSIDQLQLHVNNETLFEYSKAISVTLIALSSISFFLYSYTQTANNDRFLLILLWSMPFTYFAMKIIDDGAGYYILARILLLPAGIASIWIGIKIVDLTAKFSEKQAQQDLGMAYIALLAIGTIFIFFALGFKIIVFGEFQ
jgi:hypothetical protein